MRSRLRRHAARGAGNDIDAGPRRTFTGEAEAERSGRLGNAFRYSARSIARQRERDYLGRYGAKTNRTGERRACAKCPGCPLCKPEPPGQLTSVFMRGLRSEHTQVLLDGIPINQGLAGAFDFANLTTDDIDRIEVVRGPQSTIYGPRALAGVIQIFTKQGDGNAGRDVDALKADRYDTFRETLQSDGKIGEFDYSIGASRLDTDNARPNNQYRNTAGLRMSAGRRTSNCESAVCLLIR